MAIKKIRGSRYIKSQGFFEVDTNGTVVFGVAYFDTDGGLAKDWEMRWGDVNGEICDVSELSDDKVEEILKILKEDIDKEKYLTCMFYCSTILMRKFDEGDSRVEHIEMMGGVWSIADSANDVALIASKKIEDDVDSSVIYDTCMEEVNKYLG